MAEIGSTLREARMRARIDITEVESATKIRAKYLRAIENEEWDLLPGPVYAKTFLRTYSAYLGLDTRMLLDEYKRRYERPFDQDSRSLSTIARDRERAARGPRMPTWVPIVGVLAVVVVALFVIGKVFGGGNGSSTTSSSTQTLTSATHTKHHRRHRTTTTPTTTPAPAAVAKLQLIPNGAVYVCVEDAHGKVLIPGTTFNVGQSIPTQHSTKLLVDLGNASVTVKVNGKQYPVAPSANPIHLVVTPSGAKTVTSGPSC